MELPPYHLPTARGVALRTWDRLKLFISEAGRVIVLMVLALNLLNSMGSDGSFGNQDSEASLLSAVGKTVTPVFAPLGLDQDNWPAAVGIFAGVLAKEAVVGTLDALYTADGPGAGRCGCGAFGVRFGRGIGGGRRQRAAQPGRGRGAAAGSPGRGGGGHRVVRGGSGRPGGQSRGVR